MADPCNKTTDPAGDLLTEAFEAVGIKVVDVTPYMPRPLCQLCLGDQPKTRMIGDGLCRLVCDRCWEAENGK